MRGESPEKIGESLLQRKYAIPFLLACIILFCNTATGINSIIGYNTSILLQSGLSDLRAHWGYVAFTVVNFLMTIVGMTLVDRKGRKFLLILGTSGIIVSLVSVGMLFLKTEKLSVDARTGIQAMVAPNQELALRFDRAAAERLLAGAGSAGRRIASGRASLAIIYSYGDFTASTSYARSGDPAAAPLQITCASCLPANQVEAFFKNPIGNLEAARSAPLRIDKALIGLVPGDGHGWRVALGLYAFMAFFALGPGVVRVAGAVGTDADAHSIQWHEHCAGHQSAGLDHAGRNLPALCQQTRLFVDVLSLLRLHGGLFPRCGLPAARDQRQNPGRDRSPFRAEGYPAGELKHEPNVLVRAKSGIR